MYQLTTTEGWGYKLHEGCRQFRPYMGQSHRLHPRQTKPIGSRTAVDQRPISLLINTDVGREDLRLLDPESTMLLRNVGECLPEHGVTSQKIRTVTETAVTAWNLALLGFFHSVTPNPRSRETTFASSILFYLQRLLFVHLILRFRRFCGSATYRRLPDASANVAVTAFGVMQIWQRATCGRVTNQPTFPHCTLRPIYIT